MGTKKGNSMKLVEEIILVVLSAIGSLVSLVIFGCIISVPIAVVVAIVKFLFF